MGAHEQDECSWGRFWAISSLLTSLSLQLSLLKFPPSQLCISGPFYVVRVAARWRRAVWAFWMPLWPLGQSAGTHWREAAV